MNNNKRLSVFCRAVKLVSTGLLAVFMSVAYVEAKVCLLPGGQCPGDPGHDSNSDSCDGYNLSQVKCYGEACEEGWECEECENASGTHYRCNKKPTPAGYTPGLEECTTPCQAYTWNGFTGTQINGKCTDIPYADATTTDPGNPDGSCYSYIMPDYVYKVNISGADVNKVSRHNCYVNITKLDGYSTTRPNSCTAYNSRLDGLGSEEHEDTMCFTEGTNIGTYFSTDERDDDVFVVETKHGTDNGVNTEPCYRATGCKSFNGWLPADQIDGNKFDFVERSSDGVTCRKAISCVAGNNWFDHQTLGKYKDIYFTMETETKSNLTCYRATGCDTEAYDYEPDGTYFTSSKQSSNGKNCWIVTGMADNAYATEELPEYFQYENKTAYLNGTDEEVTFYRIKQCMDYAYASQPDAKHFSFSSQTRKLLGGNDDITCWNVTGKGAHAYTAEEKITTHFVYDSGLTAYLNGTKTQGTYYNATSCISGTSVLSTDKNTTYLTYDTGQTQKFGGVDDPQTCYRATGCNTSGGALATADKDTSYFNYDSGSSLTGFSCVKATGCATNVVLAGNRNTDYFVYDSGKTHSGFTCHKVSSCVSTAVEAGSKNTTYLTYDSGVTSGPKTCYKANGCNTSGGALAAANKDTSYFKYDSGTTQNGYSCVKATGCATNVVLAGNRNTSYITYDGGKTHSGYTCHKTTGCASGAVPSKTTTYFTYDSGTTSGAQTCYKATGCGGNAVVAGSRDTSYFTYTDKTENGNTCYLASGCATNVVLAGNRNTNYITYDSGKSSNGHTCFKTTGCATNAVASKNTTYFTYDSGVTSGAQSCYKANGCNTSGGALATSSKDTGYFTYDSGATQNGYSCVKATGCATNVILSGSVNTGVWTYDSGKTHSGKTCYKVTGCKVTASKPAACKTYSSAAQGGKTCYYNISTTGAGDCTTTKPTCRTWTKGTDTNGNTVYYNISNVFGNSCVTAGNRANCYNYPGAKQDTDGTWWYYNPSLMATGATTQKPAVTDSDCHTYSYGAPSNNGNGTSCYYNIASVQSSKPAASQTINNGGGTTTKTCSASCTCSCSCSTSCTCSRGCSYSQGCGCSGSQTYSGTQYASGTKWGTGTQNGTKSGSCTKYRDDIQTRSVTCNSNGTGWSTGSWAHSSYGNWKDCTCTANSSCSCSGSCNSCGNYGGCGSCGGYGGCTNGGWGSCNGQSDYYTGNYNTAGCGCRGTKYQYHYCLSGWGGWSGCSGESCGSDGSCAHINNIGYVCYSNSQKSGSGSESWCSNLGMGLLSASTCNNAKNQIYDTFAPLDVMRFWISGWDGSEHNYWGTDRRYDSSTGNNGDSRFRAVCH